MVLMLFWNWLTLYSEILCYTSWPPPRLSSTLFTPLSLWAPSKQYLKHPQIWFFKKMTTQELQKSPVLLGLSDFPTTPGLPGSTCASCATKSSGLWTCTSKSPSCAPGKSPAPEGSAFHRVPQRKSGETPRFGVGKRGHFKSLEWYRVVVRSGS